MGAGPMLAAVEGVAMREVPGIVKAAVIVTFFNTWVLFEETVVDRYGLWQYMPYYRVAQLCSWDIGALALITWITLRTLRRARYTISGA
jgi:hypothetical protein